MGIPELPAPLIIETFPCFSVYDSKSSRFGPPQTAPTEDVAVRQFSDLCSTPGSVYYRHAADFDLFYCGEWDSVACKFLVAEPKQIVNGAQVVVPEAPSA